MTTRRTVEPADYPVTLAEMKLYLRVDNTAEDTLITTLIASATEQCEKLTGRSLITQTWETTIDEFADAIELLHPPVQSVSSVAYVDQNGDAQTMDLADFYLDAQEPAWLVPAVDTEWPAVREQANAVTVTSIHGYGYSPDYVPPPIRSWIMLRVGTMYENRGEIVIGHSVQTVSFVDGLLDPYRINVMA